MNKFKIQLLSILNKNKIFVVKSKFKLLFSSIFIPCIIILLLIVLMYFSLLYTPDNKESYIVGIGDLLGPKHKLLVGSSGGLNQFQKLILEKLILITWYNNNQYLNIKSVGHWFIEYDNYTDADIRYSKRDEYIIGAIWFDTCSELNKDITYTLRIDSEYVYDHQIQFKEHSKIQDTYLNNGFTKIQEALDSAILIANGYDIFLLGNAQPTPTPSDHSFERWAQAKYLILKYIGGIFISLSIFSSSYNLITNILVEKESNKFEIMKIMGLNSFTYHLANTITGIICNIPIVLILTIVFKSFGFYHLLPWYSTFTLFFVYSISLILLAQIISLLFNKSKSFGFIFSLLVIGLSTIGYYSINLNINQTIKLLFSLISPIGITLFNYSIIIKDLNLIHFISSTTTLSSLKFIPNEMLIFIVLGLNIVIYLLVLYILDTLNSNCYRIKSISRWYRKSNYQKLKFKDYEMEIHQNNDQLYYEYDKEQQQQQPTISISNLRKEYKNKNKHHHIVLEDINLNIYSNNTLALVGPNGCGKSTLFDILIGLKNSTCGEILLNGLDIDSNKEKIRSESMMGICRQSNDLWDQLTVLEHLQLYSGIKGLTNESLDYYGIIQDLKFENKLNQLVSTLSGGERRILSIAISFIGNSTNNIIILDEPTSGIDLKSKRDIWNFLNKRKKDKTIIFTTHDLNEASIISDRIAIISNGKIKSEGSYLYLKNNFSDGYTLSIDKESNQLNVDSITNIISSVNIIGSSIKLNSDSQLNYSIPLNQSNKFKSLFEQLESEKENLLIKNIGISNSSLEDLYLKICNNNHSNYNYNYNNNNNPTLYNSSTSGGDGNNNSHIYSSSSSSSNSSSNNGNNNIQQIISILIKRFKVLKNDCKPLVSAIVISLLLIISGIIFYKTVPTIKLYQDYNFSIAMDINQVYNSNKIPFTINTSNSNFSIGMFESLSTYSELTNKTIYIASEAEYQNYLTQNYYKYAGSFEFLDQWVVEYFNILFYKIYYNNNYLHSIPIYLNFVHNIISKSQGGFNINAFSHPLPHNLLLIEESAKDINIPSCIIFYICVLAGFTYLSVSLSSYYLKERVCGSTRLLIQNGLKIYNYWISSLIFDYSIIYFIIIIFASLMVLIEQSFRDQFIIFIVSSILFIHSILPLSYLISNLFNSSGKFIGVFFSVVYCVGFIITLVDFLCRALAYKEYDFKQEERWDQYEKLLYVISPLMCYAKILAIITNFPGVQRVDIKTIEDYWSINHCLSPILALLFNSIILHLLLFNINNICKIKNIINRIKSIKFIKSKDEYNQLDELYSGDDNGEEEEIDKPITIKNLNKIYKSKSSCCGSNNNDILAIKDITLSISSGEILGICGSIGSGKSTIIKILSGEILSTSGQVLINGYDIVKERIDALKSVSVCEQFDDPLIGLLTARETIQLFCKIKGVDNQQINNMVESFIKVMDLTSIADKLISTYSGGEKRKVSLLISCINAQNTTHTGQTSILLLDEFTTNCDPITKRKMWNLISRFKKDKLILFTSHSIKECEYLCDRVLILNHHHHHHISSSSSSISFLGNIQTCKYQFGLYYSIDIFIKSIYKDQSEQQEQIINIIKTSLPTPSKLIEHHNLYLNFEIPIQPSISSLSITSLSPSISSSSSTTTNSNDSILLLSSIFNTFDNLKQYIDDYSITQSPSIEKSFLKLNNNQ